MKRTKKNSLSLVLFVLLAMSFLVLCVIVSVEAKKHNSKECNKCHIKQNPPQEGRRDSPLRPPGTAAAPSPAPHRGYNASPSSNHVFDVISFGAHGNGVSDDSEALLLAWKAACVVQGAQVVIPEEFSFLIMPVTLQGPCMPQLVLKSEGTLLAPAKEESWSKSNLFQWLIFKWLNNFTIQGTGTVDGQGFAWWNPSTISNTQRPNFKWLNNFTIQGTGTVDGQGFAWWNPSTISDTQKRSKHVASTRSTAIRFYASKSVTIRDINILNSPQCHLKFDNSSGIKVDNITIFSPEASPNTDGIHLQNTKDVEIQHSNIGCEKFGCHAERKIGYGISTSNNGLVNLSKQEMIVYPYRLVAPTFTSTTLTAGPGMELGGLGKDKTISCVSDIVIEEVSLQNTLAGVRMKTWQGGLGSVKNISFSNIQVADVKYPIIIDQYYCEDKKSCKNQTGAVAITGVKYQKIIGTYTVQPVHLACSDTVPCTDVNLIDVQLRPTSGIGSLGDGLCWKSYGKTEGPIVPSSIDYCLSRESGSLRRAMRLHEHGC